MLHIGSTIALLLFTAMACATTSQHEEPPMPTMQPTAGPASAGPASAEPSSAGPQADTSGAPAPGSTATSEVDGTASTAHPEPTASGDSSNGAAAPGSVGMANPASVNCIKQGGKVVFEKGPNGESGICVFPDGSRCEEWALFRGQCKRGQQK